MSHNHDGSHVAQGKIEEKEKHRNRNIERKKQNKVAKCVSTCTLIQCRYDCVQYKRHEIVRSKDIGVAVVVLKFV